MENFQELRDPKNPRGVNRFGLATKVVYATFGLLAIVLGIVALVKCDNLKKAHDIHVAEMQQGTESEYYESLSPVGAARFESNSTQAKRLIEFLITVATVPDSQKKSALVHRRKVYTALNNSEIFSCESNGQPLKSCLWGRTLKGQRQVVVIDDQTGQDGGRKNVEGVLYVGDGLKDGNCSVRIESVTEEDVGSWSCTLVSQGGAIFNGEVSITTMRRPAPSIYFATTGGGVKAYSLETSSVRTIASSSEVLYGVAYDSFHDKIYWCSASRIYRSTSDGTELETMSGTYSSLQGLTYDWIAGNLYVVSGGGNIIACDINFGRPFTCATVITGQGDVEGLALNPTEGTMYYTRFTPSPSIVKAGMDGSNPTTIVTGLSDAFGIVIDYETSRLYWADQGQGAKKIQSSNLQGADKRVEVQLSTTAPYGLAVLNDTIIWSNGVGGALQQRGTESGAIVRSLYTGSNTIRHLTIVPPYNLPTNRINHCANQNCPEICLLTTSSFRCVS